MTYIKLLTALAGLALLTACGGGGSGTGDSSQTTDCKANAFHADCLADTSALALRITDCITAGNAGDTKCASLTSDATMNTAITDCLTNPFTDACKADGAFATYADTARVNRVEFCKDDSTSSSLCTALLTCRTNPFGASCGTFFEPAKNPYCENNPTATSCVNTTVWLASFTAGTAPPETPNTTTRKNEFLQATAMGFDSEANAGIRQSFGSPTTDIAIQTLTFAEADTATGGVAFFGGDVYVNNAKVENAENYYAGILAGTNLGAPITETITKAVTWTGQIGADAKTSSAQLLAGEVTNFELDITFDGTRGTMKTVFAAPNSGGLAYEIDGVFDANGIITGSANFGAGNATIGIDKIRFADEYSPGTLSGIIGQNGAVGVFHSDNANPEAGSGASKFSGGFVVKSPSPCQVADNCVDTAAWLASFGASPPPATRAASSAGTDTFGSFLNLASDVRAISETGFGASTVTKGILTLDGDGTDGMHGVVYLGGGNATNNNRQAFVAVLPTTNLGAPLVSPPTTIIWPGKYHNLTFGNAQDANFVINFGEKTITANPVDTTGATTNFALRFTPATGVITGTVTRGTTATARGLIGDAGLVGVFVDTRTGRPAGDSVLFGGFVADNPDTNP